MQRTDNGLQLSASDLVGHLNCVHLTGLDLAVAEGLLAKPSRWDPVLELLRERGFRHEEAFVAALRAEGLSVTRIDGVGVSPEAMAQTEAAMAQGCEVIVQAALQAGCWAGRADVLRRIDSPDLPSRFGPWSYEPIDTKLARETRASSVLQLCLYADLLASMQARVPEQAFVVTPGSDLDPQAYRIADYAAYYRRARAAAETAAISPSQTAESYPDPKEHCEICRWQNQCEARRRADDHLCLVAGITQGQIQELRAQGIDTLAALAEMPLPLAWKPRRGSVQALEKVRGQARIQHRSRETGEICYELLPLESGAGLAALPRPCRGDVFLDLEGDPFVGTGGLEYLFGYWHRDESGHGQYVADWVVDHRHEQAAFEAFVDVVTARRVRYPDMHIYHFAPYEPAAFKRLMGRYGSREDEVDTLLRGQVFVDLYRVVRQALRAGVESYSIKRLEPLFGFTREVNLRDANAALAAVEAALELNDPDAIDETRRETVMGYNRDDCVSVEALRNWLEERRGECIAQGATIARPGAVEDAPSEALGEHLERVNQLSEALSAGVPAEPTLRSESEQARWLLAQLLHWHRREKKASAWEFFRLRDLGADELLDERAGLADLEWIETVAVTQRGIRTDRYRFSPQDSDVRTGDTVKGVGGTPLGKVEAIDAIGLTLDIKKTGETADSHPPALFVSNSIRDRALPDALLRIGESVAAQGIEGAGAYRAARALLLREPPPVAPAEVRLDGESALEAACRLAARLEGGFLALQGAPGTGKSYTGARMIGEMVRAGLKVGITANSHKVIRNLIDAVLRAAPEMEVPIRCIQKPREFTQEPLPPNLSMVRTNEAAIKAMREGSAQVCGATPFLWSHQDAHDLLDVLVVDEAAQMSLANVVAAAQSARALVLLGDPQQLDQPTQGTHPDGVGVSALEHLLGEAATIDPARGLFLEQTWRMSPAICAFGSRLFYENRLTYRAGCEGQRINAPGSIGGSGLRFVPVAHEGNQNSSAEEADVVARLVEALLTAGTTWIDRDGEEHPMSLDDILIITPYNAQVHEIRMRLVGARIGTVDKFQGQEAPVAIYSMATSSYRDAPRGMEFLYSANRFNVAISRAKCMAILVASPAVFEPECRSPRQMRLANAYCDYLEQAEEIQAP